MHFSGQRPVVDLSDRPVNVFMGDHVVVEYLLLRKGHVEHAVVHTGESKLFPMNGVTFSHDPINLVVWSEAVVTNIFGVCDFTIVRDGHGMTSFGTGMIENPVTARMVTGGESALDGWFSRQTGEHHVSVYVSDLLMECVCIV